VSWCSENALSLVKRQSVDDLTCTFCSEPETCNHLFFECVVAKVVSSELNNITGLTINNFSFESTGSMWLCEEKYKVHNSAFSATMWVLWNTRNDLYFNRSPWIGLQTVWRKIAYLMYHWQILLAGE
jgi:hypothetical protein